MPKSPSGSRPPTSEPVSRRTRPAKAALSADALVSAALAILDADGLDAVTMRRVAQALDTGPASLYVYVANRNELLALVYDRVLGEIPLPAVGPVGAPNPRWREELVELIQAAITILGGHRGIATVALGDVPTSPNALAVAETILGLLAGSGIDDFARSLALDLINLYITAAAAEQSAYFDKGAEGLTEESAVAAMDEEFAKLSAADHPHMVSMRDALTRGSGDVRDAWSIDVLLNGIVGTPAPAEE
ncbi:TetR/AcrR family transcriptional regulator [Embleya sp. NBC_00896]|uniref:TetR/AcrR family transcriptional regulator n=1 Tax=Embleya sp. NBC_00896 TaxID=2975961 RepID=UPI00386EC3F1|nr:TetR/AcrR family transcriptional regulator [Embleya sp. NBC_00896]